MKDDTPAFTSVPTIPKTTKKPADTAAPTSSAVPTLARLSSSVPFATSMPRKYDRYAGSIANPHGFTVATAPAVNA